MAQIGELLTRIRTKKDLSLRDVEQATKIRIKYLRALEAEEFEQIPGEVYVIGFLRTYCRYLGLDADLIVNEYRDQTKMYNDHDDETDAAEKSTSESLMQWKRNIKVVAAVCIGILILAGSVGMLLYSSDDNGSKPAVSESSTPDLSPNNDVSKDGSGSEHAGNVSNEKNEDKERDETVLEKTTTAPGINAEITVEAEKRCWVKFTVDGNNTYTGTIVGPLSKTINAEDNFAAVFGNAGAVSIKVNGKQITDIGGDGAVSHMQMEITNSETLIVRINGKEKMEIKISTEKVSNQ
ncbi:DUF4115 domain-containing protein [Metallumcola ferriviriculae]|uniref:DUF4115 domain-containing protein n=1 Tax=Metallumcola ferriviriculae TaxID=3039180 RepID=A0AAU0UQ39_9FIRM|nr:DUF4115 domain-containing protein [Desulfitibacteraceae bacterium MK1]